MLQTVAGKVVHDAEFFKRDEIENRARRLAHDHIGCDVIWNDIVFVEGKEHGMGMLFHGRLIDAVLAVRRVFPHPAVGMELDDKVIFFRLLSFLTSYKQVGL